MTGFSKHVRIVVEERSGGRCERCGVVRDDMQYHHRRPRGMGGSRQPDTNTAANCVLLCSYDHALIESMRDEYLELGWLVRQGQKPADVPIWRFKKWVLLDDHGCVIPVKETA